MNYFEENRKFLGLNGVLGRRNFIINCVIIEIIESLLFSTPLIYIIFANPQIITSFRNTSAFPQWMYIWMAGVGILSSIFYFSSITRRVRDILGVEDDNRISVISGVLTVLVFCGYLPVLGGFLKSVMFFIIIFLALQQGKITGEKPKCELVKFNWGAFFGTWMWGLFNKSFITLLMIPLFFTTGGFWFMLLCGLNGNEWAYAAKKTDNLNEFHKSQANQAVIWTVLTPILFMFLSVFGMVLSGAALYKYSKLNPEFAQKMLSKMQSLQTSAVELSFDKIEFADGEYKFYLTPEEWENSSDSLKKSTFKNAAVYVLLKNGKASLSGVDLFAFNDEVRKVKIYSTFNNEVFADFQMDNNKAEELRKQLKDKKITALEAQKIWDNSVKLNNHPSKS